MLINGEKFIKFKKNRRAYYALILFCVVFFLSLFSELIANDKPLIVKYKNSYYFPIIFSYNDDFFGGDFPTEANYKDITIRQNIEQNGWMFMPLVPYSFNTVDYETRGVFTE